MENRVKWFENKNSSGFIIYKEDEAVIYLSNNVEGGEYIEVVLARTGDKFKVENISKTIKKDWN